MLVQPAILEIENATINQIVVMKIVKNIIIKYIKQYERMEGGIIGEWLF
jgi:hypothetical protein